MADISVIEFIVYALVGYSGIVLLISSAFREIPATASGSTIRAIWILPSLFCVYMLASAGTDIYFEETTTTLINQNSTETWTETKQDKITLYQPVWVTLHILFFFMLLIFFIWNIIQLLVKRE